MRHPVRYWILSAMLVMACSGLYDADGLTGVRELGVAGGTVTLGHLVVAFPEGALASSTLISIEEVTEGLPPDLVGPAYHITPDDLELLAPITVTITLGADATTSASGWPDEVVMGMFEDGAWIDSFESHVDDEEHSVWAGVDRLGFVGVRHQTSCTDEICDNGLDDDCDGATDEGCEQCVPKCNGKDCGSDLCGASCGTCSAPDVCTPLGTCCHPSCGDKVCGDDGCGGSCGTCGPLEYCTSEGTCAVGECADGNTIPWDGCTEGVLTKQRVSTSWRGEHEYPLIAARSDGSYLIVWKSSSLSPLPTSAGIFGQLFFHDGTKDGGELLLSDEVTETTAPAVTALSDGSFAVAWYAAASSDSCAAAYYSDLTEVKLRWLDATGRAIAPPLVVNETPASPRFSGYLAALANDSVIVVYRSDEPGEGGYQALGRVIGPDGVETVELPLVEGVGSSDALEVVGLPSGGFALSGTKKDDGVWFVSCFDSAGELVGAASSSPIKNVYDMEPLPDGTFAVLLHGDVAGTSELVRFDDSCTQLTAFASSEAVLESVVSMTVTGDERLLFASLVNVYGPTVFSSTFSEEGLGSPLELVTEQLMVETYDSIEIRGLANGAFVVAWREMYWAPGQPMPEPYPGVYAQLFAPTGAKHLGGFCETDGDCVAMQCHCDHTEACDAETTCAATACSCDEDCAGTSAAACMQDDVCDSWCPTGVDPDCSGSFLDGRYCMACGTDGVCNEACDIAWGGDPDCVACYCGHHQGVCEVEQQESLVPCPCDEDCLTKLPCIQDFYADHGCPDNADPDIPVSTCALDMTMTVCEVVNPCSTDPVWCDLDCQSGQHEPCAADGYCDAYCPTDLDPDCDGCSENGQWCQ